MTFKMVCILTDQLRDSGIPFMVNAVTTNTLHLSMCVGPTSFILASGTAIRMHSDPCASPILAGDKEQGDARPWGFRADGVISNFVLSNTICLYGDDGVDV